MALLFPITENYSFLQIIILKTQCENVETYFQAYNNSQQVILSTKYMTMYKYAI